MRVLMQLVRTISVLVAIVTFISGVLVVIAAFRYNSVCTGLIAEFASVNVYGLLGIEGYSSEFVNKMMIVLAFFVS